MSNKLSVVSDRSSALPEGPSVALSECRTWIAVIAGERPFGATRQSWLNRAAGRSDLPYRTIRAIYYGEIDDRCHPAVIKLKSAAERHGIVDLASRLEKCAHDLRAMAARL